jgi:hypothetical protein
MTGLTKKVQQLIESSNNIEIKNACLAYLFESRKDNVKATKALFESLEKIEDPAINNLVAEKELYKNIAKSDFSTVKRFGVYEGVQKLRGNKIYEHPQFKYAMDRFSRDIDNNVSEHLMVRDFLSTLNAFRWDKTVDSVYESVNKEVDTRGVEIEVRNTIHNIKRTDTGGFYDIVTDKLESWLTNESKSNTDLVSGLKMWSGHPAVKNLLNTITLLENSKGKFGITVDNSGCTVTDVYSPVTMFEGSVVFQINGKYMAKKKGEIFVFEASKAPAKFKAICEAFFNPAVSVKDNNIHVKVGKKSVQIAEGSIHMDGKAVTLNQLSMITEGNMFFYREDLNNKLNIISTLSENYNSIVNLEFAKSIESTIVEGALVTIMKLGADKVYVNKVNPKMNENVIRKVNGMQAVGLVKNFLNYDISESFRELLDKEARHKVDIKKDRDAVLEAINIVESEIENIDNSIEDDKELEDNEEVSDLKQYLEDELNALKSKWQDLEVRLNKFDKVSADDLAKVDQFQVAEPGVEPGEEPNEEEPGEEPGVLPGEEPGEEEPGEEDLDESFEPNTRVKIKSTDEVGIITTNNGDSCIVSLDNGDTLEVECSDIMSLEEYIEDAVQDNEDAGDDERGEGKDDDGYPVSVNPEDDDDIDQTDITFEMVKEKIKYSDTGRLLRKGSKAFVISVDGENRYFESKREALKTALNEGSEENEEEQPSFVKAQLTTDIGPYMEGDIIEIDAVSYTSSGDDDQIPVNDPKEDMTTVPKKYLKVIEDSEDNKSKSQVVSDIQAKLEAALKMLSDAETLIDASSIINSEVIKSVKDELSQYVNTLDSEGEILDKTDGLEDIKDLEDEDDSSATELDEPES